MNLIPKRKLGEFKDSITLTDSVREIIASSAIIGTAQIQDASIGTAEIADASITTAKIVDANITTAKIEDLAVTTAKIDSLAVTTAKIDNLAVTDAKINDLAVSKLTAGTISSETITLAIAAGTGDCYIAAGKTDFDNTTAGFILGLDDSDSDKAKFYIGDSSVYMNWTGSALNVYGATVTVGGGSVVLNATGVHISAAGGSSLMDFYDGSYHSYIFQSGVGMGLSNPAGGISLSTKYSGGYVSTVSVAALNLSLSSCSYMNLPGTAGDVGSPSEGMSWYDTTNHVFKYHNGTAIKTIATV